jgi:hypothetical protein
LLILNAIARANSPPRVDIWAEGGTVLLALAVRAFRLPIHRFAS